MEASAFVREKTSSCDFLLCEDADCAVKPSVLGSSTPAKRARENRIPIVTADWVVECIRSRTLVDPASHPGKFEWDLS